MSNKPSQKHSHICWSNWRSIQRHAYQLP